MKISEVVDILDEKVLAGKDQVDVEIDSAFGSDLMSDVLAFVNDRVLLLTGLVNLQVVRTAEMMDISAIVFVRGKRPDANIIELAETKGLVILTTDLTMYESCGKLYAGGLTGNDR